MTSTPVRQVEIDCLAVARRILSGPTAWSSATPFEIAAMAACTVRESVGAAPEIPVLQDAELPASIAAAVAQLIVAHAALTHAEAGSMSAFDTAFATLKARFEKEFPDGSQL